MYIFPREQAPLEIILPASTPEAQWKCTWSALWPYYYLQCTHGRQQYLSMCQTGHPNQEIAVPHPAQILTEGGFLLYDPDTRESYWWDHRQDVVRKRVRPIPSDMTDLQFYYTSGGALVLGKQAGDFVLRAYVDYRHEAEILVARTSLPMSYVNCLGYHLDVMVIVDGEWRVYHLNTPDQYRVCVIEGMPGRIKRAKGTKGFYIVEMESGVVGLVESRFLNTDDRWSLRLAPPIGYDTKPKWAMDDYNRYPRWGPPPAGGGVPPTWDWEVQAGMGHDEVLDTRTGRRVI